MTSPETRELVVVGRCYVLQNPLRRNEAGNGGKPELEGRRLLEEKIACILLNPPVTILSPFIQAKAESYFNTETLLDSNCNNMICKLIFISLTFHI